MFSGVQPAVRAVRLARTHGPWGSVREVSCNAYLTRRAGCVSRSLCLTPRCASACCKLHKAVSWLHSWLQRSAEICRAGRAAGCVLRRALSAASRVPPHPLCFRSAPCLPHPTPSVSTISPDLRFAPHHLYFLDIPEATSLIRLFATTHPRMHVTRFLF